MFGNKKQSKTVRRRNTFILEPIFTPSGVADNPFGDGTPDLDFDTGTFTVGDSGEVGVDFLFDGGGFSQGEVAIFSLDGMEDFEPGSEDFIQEAARRALSNSDQGHVVISDATDGARFSGRLGEGDRNAGDYRGVQTFQMKAGDEFGVMLAANHSIEEVAAGQIKGVSFSMATANPDDHFQFGQITDLTGDGNTFAFEDWQLSGNSDRDYNDIILQFRGATGEADLIDQWIAPEEDWRDTDLGEAIQDYALAYTDGVEYTAEQFEAAREFQPLVGIIDTGFAADNPDLDYGNITAGYDFIDGDADPFLSAGEGNEHGTHVLGIIAAQQDNGVGIDGINDDAPIWLGRAVGSGRWADSLIDFVDAAVESEQPNAVVNLSMDLTQTDADGNTFTRYELTPGERAALEYARQNNVLVVVGAGNDGNIMSALGQSAQEFDNVLTVGAADGLDRADYSSYGNGLGLLADGGTVGDELISTVGDGLGKMAGTSVATAKVTGAVSQVWAANPELSYRQVIELLKGTAQDLGAANWDRETGAGLLNMAAAVQLAKATKAEAHYAPHSWIPDSWSGEGKFATGERAVHNGPAGTRPHTFSNTTLWDIAVREWGDGRLWPRILKQNGTSYTSQEARRIPNGTVVYIPDSNYNPNPAPVSPQLASPILSRLDANYFNARPQYYTSGNIFALSMYGSSLVGGRGHTEGNCTWYAHGRVLELGGSKAALQSMNRNANLWHTLISNGTQIVSSPQPGDIAQWSRWYTDSRGQRRQMNHVAVVEKVNSDGTIVISESHWKSEYSGSNYLGRNNGTLHNVRTISAGNPDRFIRVPGVTVQNGTPANAAGTFQGRVIATIGANLRDRPTTASAKVGSANYGAVLTFDKVETGEFIRYDGLGTATDQWYRIAGTDDWISAAIVNGSPSASTDNTVAKPGEQQAYMVQAGDTLWSIAQRYLGDGNRWRELQKADGSTFTNAEALTLQIGQLVYIPVKYDPQPDDTNPNSEDDKPEANPVDITIPKAIQYIWDEINTNRSSIILNDIAALNQKSVEKILEYSQQVFPNLLTLGSGIFSKLDAYYKWYKQVKTGADWDHKLDVIDLNKEEYGDNGHWSEYKGKKYKYEIWSNVHYGYIGRIGKFIDDELLGGAGIAQLKTNLSTVGISWDSVSGFIESIIQTFQASNPDATLLDPSSIDDPGDKASVEFGIYLYEKYGLNLTQEQFISELEQSNLHEIYS